jgi:hypothetical protein
VLEHSSRLGNIYPYMQTRAEVLLHQKQTRPCLTRLSLGENEVILTPTGPGLSSEEYLLYTYFALAFTQGDANRTNQTQMVYIQDPNFRLSSVLENYHYKQRGSLYSISVNPQP